jgi:hypothetical protein
MICSIDVGWKNLAMCFMSIESGNFYSRKVDVVKLLNKKKFEEKLIVEYIGNLISKNEESFKKVSICVIEQQMKRKCLIIQHVIKTFMKCRNIPCTYISPRSVRAFFKISTGKYSLNKELSVRKVKQLISKEQYKTEVSVFKKRDDVADAILIAIYTRKNYTKIVEKILKT